MTNTIEEKAGPPCILCGGDTFTWGTVRAEQKLIFTPKTLFAKRIASLRQHDAQIVARACDKCGNAALFLNKQ